VPFMVCYSWSPPDDHTRHAAIYLNQQFYELNQPNRRHQRRRSAGYGADGGVVLVFWLRGLGISAYMEIPSMAIVCSLLSAVSINLPSGPKTSV
jgi:hypothetical protein